MAEPPQQQQQQQRHRITSHLSIVVSCAYSCSLSLSILSSSYELRLLEAPSKELACNLKITIIIIGLLYRDERVLYKELRSYLYIYTIEQATKPT